MLEYSHYQVRMVDLFLFHVCYLKTKIQKASKKKHLWTKIE